MTHPRTIVAVLLLLAATNCASAEAAARKPHEVITGKVTSIGDVDTLAIDGKKMRLHAVDGPEIQHNKKQHDQPYGPEAKAETTKLALGKKVTAEVVGTYPWPPFDPVIEVTLPDGTNLADDLIDLGAVWVDPRYKPTKKRVDAMEAARAAHKGLWAQPKPIAPWDWRKNHLATKPEK